MTLDAILDTVAGVCLVVGAFLSLAAGVGLLRFPDLLSRMHAATKPQILGVVLVLAAIALSDRSWTTLLALTPVLMFQLLTAPVASHMIGRAAYRSGHFNRSAMLVDELQDANDRGRGPGTEPDRGPGAEPDETPERQSP